MTRFFLSYAKTLFSNRELTIKEKLHLPRFSMTNRLATQCAHNDFFRALAKGEGAIEELHQKCTGKTFKIAA